MALTTLLDTSVATRLGRPEVQRRIAELSKVGELGRSAMTDLEIGFSASSVADDDRLAEMLEPFRSVPVHSVDFTTARQTQRQLAAAGLKGRKVADLLIAAVASRLGLIVLHYDRDFDHITTVTTQPTEWVVPAGSID